MFFILVGLLYLFGLSLDSEAILVKHNGWNVPVLPLLWWRKMCSMSMWEGTVHNPLGTQRFPQQFCRNP